MSAYDTVILADSPVSYWSLNDPSGTTAADSADSNPGTYAGGFTLGGAAPWTNMDGSTLFNGSSGYASVPDASNLHLSATPGLTIEGWVKSTYSGVNYQVVWSKYSATSPNPGFALALTSGAILGMWVGNGVAWFTGGANLATGTWHHVVGTLSGTTITLYVDGVLVGSGTQTPSLTYTGTGAIGCSSAATLGTNSLFVGSLSSVALYSVALTAAQVRAHFFAGPNPTFGASVPSKPSVAVLQAAWSANLAGAYMLGEGTGTSAADFSGNSKTGSLVGGMTWSTQPTGPGLLAVDDSTSPGCYCGVGTLGYSGVTALTFSTYSALNTASDSPTAINERILIGATRAGVGTPQCAIWFNASQNALHFNARYTNFPDLVAAAPPLNTPTLITGRITAAGEQSIWYNGVKVAAQTLVSFSYATDVADSCAIGGASVVSPGDNWSGPLACAYFLKGASWTDAQIMALALDPFAPGRGPDLIAIGVYSSPQSFTVLRM